MIIGVAPNTAIAFVSALYPGFISDKEIVKQSGLLNHMEAGDLIFADKGLLIQDIGPPGVSGNIPPFLEHGRLSENEVKLRKLLLAGST